jgi:hypothetical protein
MSEDIHATNLRTHAETHLTGRLGEVVLRAADHIDALRAERDALHEAVRALAKRWQLAAQSKYDEAERPGQPGEAIRAAEADGITLDTHARELLALLGGS